MKHPVHLAAAATVAALAVSLTPLVVSADDGDAPTFKEFAAATYRDADHQYIVNGDEPVANKQKLRDFYWRLVGGDRTAAKSTGTSIAVGDSQSLVVNTVNGQDDTWSMAQVGNLTYCVSTKFGSRYSNVVNAMDQGVALWEGASSAINYIHVSSQDANCSTRNNSVVFSVEPTKTQQYIARAFFPSTSKRSRNILVNATSLMSSGSWTPGNIMGHELGHTLGFRHEHTRPESGTCFEDNNWRALTAYDSASIMHYPQCNGTSEDLSMTNLDRQGAAALYGN